MSVAPSNPYRAIALKLASVFLFVVMASLVKRATEDVPPSEAVFFRSAFAVPVILFWLWQRGELRHGLKTSDPLGHAWRGLIGSAAMAMSFAGLSILPLYEVKAIQYAMPLFAVLLAWIMLGETIRKVRVTAVGLGMIGVLIILWPRLTTLTGDAMDPRLAVGALVVLTGSFCAAMAQVFVRRLVETEETGAIVFYFSLTATLLGLLTWPLGYFVPVLAWTTPPALTFLALVAAGVVGGVGQIFLTSAYRYADASIVAPFEYASMLFAVAIGLLFFDEVPTAHQLFGAIIVIAAGVLIIWRERQLKIQRNQGRKLVTAHG